MANYDVAFVQRRGGQLVMQRTGLTPWEREAIERALSGIPYVVDDLPSL